MDSYTSFVKFAVHLFELSMNISKKISIIILYFFIVHVYSFVHWHAHEHENQIELHISVHPPDLPIHEHNHEDHQCHTQHAGESDVLGDWNFTVQKINIKIFSSDYFVDYNKIPEEKLKVFAGNSPELVLKFPLDDIVKILPQRAPPQIC